MINRKSLESGRHLESLMKGLEVLDCIERSPASAATLTEISTALGLYKSRAIRLCGTLEHMGYLIHDRQEKLYRLGPRLLSLGKAYEGTNPLILAVKPTLEALHKQLDATVSFYVLRGLKRVCVAKVTARYGWTNTLEGQERELHYGSTGKVFLAFGSQRLREEFFSSPEPYVRLTPFTMTSSKQVWDELHTVREKGYACSFEERVMGLAGLAAPVFEFGGDLVGALSVAGAKENFTAERMPLYIAPLLGASKDLSRQLGFKEASGKGGP